MLLPQRLGPKMQVKRPDAKRCCTDSRATIGGAPSTFQTLPTVSTRTSIAPDSFEPDNQPRRRRARDGGFGSVFPARDNSLRARYLNVKIVFSMKEKAMRSGRRRAVAVLGRHG